ncbi:hypothetical protein K461DRAFT_271100 [Myriangium duriaei CBS 260.36]|uniref:Uncharacterized protein n=1 Tax=Myriangium duriaei CBS 260.36 TaxID=1168546 RepID=A0A9P4IVZ6_9PEZI|nr:hypothetical protein K461DRAFT_271100 [Myriangium duriaei CBS 260.36]
MALHVREATPSRIAYTYDAYARWYGLEDAIKDASGNSTNGAGFVTLWDSGCRVDGGWNCTVACLDPVVGPQLTWNSDNASYTLQNCMVLPLLARAAATKTLVEDTAGLLEKYQIPVSSSLGASTDGWPVINQCTVAFCNQTGGSNCAINATVPTKWTVAGEKTPILNIDKTICDNAPKQPSADIAGIGIMLAYLLQYLIAIFGFAYTTIVQFVNHRRKKAWETSRLSSAVEHLLAEFQETQIFFIITIQVAALIALFGMNRNFMEASSWQQMWNTLGLFYLIACAGVHPIIFNYFSLRKIKPLKRVRGLLLGTIFCVAVSTFTYIKIITTKPRPDQAKSEQPGPRECGSVAPTLYCMGGALAKEDDIDLDATHLVHLMITLPAIMLFLLSLEHVFTFVDRNKLFGTRAIAATRKAVAKWPAWLPKWIGILLVVIGQWYMGFLMFLDFIAFAVFWVDMPDQKWSLGQVIAVAVWIPVLVKFFHDLMRGFDKALLHLLPKGFEIRRLEAAKVRRKSTDDDKEGSSQHDDEQHDGEEGDDETDVSANVSNHLLPMHSSKTAEKEDASVYFSPLQSPIPDGKPDGLSHVLSAQSTKLDEKRVSSQEDGEAKDVKEDALAHGPPPQASETDDRTDALSQLLPRQSPKPDGQG